MRGEYCLHSTHSLILLELPPHARRIPITCDIINRVQGTTSACAENTPRRRGRHQGFWNYLRMRGEYPSRVTLLTGSRELPPHARRIPNFIHSTSLGLGTTSACAENTVFPRLAWGRFGNYLRMRGEYPSLKITAVRGPELPPHARRILWRPYTWRHHMGTTSACAENTAELLVHHWTPGNYLRMRGEYRNSTRIRGLFRELPPHARRIPEYNFEYVFWPGTTSACAENTPRPGAFGHPWWNYLRMRGEYLSKTV